MLLTVKSLDDRYTLLKNIGKGSFGHVSLARVRSKAALEHTELRAGSMIAIKTMKKKLQSISDYNFLREVEFIREVKPHKYLVSIHDMFVDSVNHHFHMSMEVMEMNLYNLMKSQDKVPFTPEALRSMLWQIISGIDHIHRHNFFHRDIKPENILVSRHLAPQNENTLASSITPQFKIKIADFGLSRHIDDRDPYTAYVSTRWYRSPEILLRCDYYSAPVDIWAFGAMAAEMANLKPLFPGANELDQFNLQVSLLGSPGHNSLGGIWRQSEELCSKLNIPASRSHCRDPATIIFHPEHKTLTDVVVRCLNWDPDTRCTARDVMYHRYFAQETTIEVPRTLKRSPLRIAKNGTHGNSQGSITQRGSDIAERQMSLAASVKQNQGLHLNKSNSEVKLPYAGVAAAVASTKDPRRERGSGTNSISSITSSIPSKKKFGHWTNLFKRETPPSEQERTSGNKENLPHEKPQQISMVQSGSYVAKIPLPQLPSLDKIAASVESLSIGHLSSPAPSADRMTPDSSTGHSTMSLSNSYHSNNHSKGPPDVVSIESSDYASIELPKRTTSLPETPSSSKSRMPPPPLPKDSPLNGKVMRSGAPSISCPIPELVAPAILQSTLPEDVADYEMPLPEPFSVIKPETPESHYEPPMSSESEYEAPVSIDEPDCELTAYERSVRDSVALMSVAMERRSTDSCYSLDEYSSEPPSLNDSPLVDDYQGSTTEVRIESNTYLSPQLASDPVWVEPEEFEYPVYTRLQTDSFKDRRMNARGHVGETD